MKTITKLLLLATAFLTTNVFSQTSVGFTAGTSIAAIRSKVDKSETSDSKAGLTAGVILNCPLSSHVSIQPALSFIQKGGKEKGGSGKAILNYLELPVNLIYNTNDYYGFFIGGGPALSAGLSGKDIYTYNNVTQKDDIKFGKDKDFKRMEVSGNLLGGYRFPVGLLLAVNYDMGFSNLFHDKALDGKLTTRYIGIRLGYLISSYKKP